MWRCNILVARWRAELLVSVRTWCGSDRELCRWRTRTSSWREPPRWTRWVNQGHRCTWGIPLASLSLLYGFCALLERTLSSANADRKVRAICYGLRHLLFIPIPSWTADQMAVLYCVELFTDSDSHPNCRLQKWNWDRDPNPDLWM